MLNFLLIHSPLFYLVQNLWRDEVFSILAAEKPISFILKGIGIEPPFYYLLLHFWMKIFGNSEIAVRGLSFLAFLLSTYLIGIWAEKTYKKNLLSWLLPVTFFLNPMLIYYAFEVRTYGWFIFFATASIINYLDKKWFWYATTTVLGFYTHIYFIFVPLVQLIHWIIINKFTIKNCLKNSFIRAISISGLFILPWLVKLTIELPKLKNSWYFPVDWHLIKSVLGNMFLGYEGTPGTLWGFTNFLSIIFLGIFIWLYRQPKLHQRNLFFLLLVFIPLIVTLSVSQIKPIFVNRYLIPVTIALVFLLAFFIESLKSKFWQFILLTSYFLLLTSFNSWFPNQHAKLDLRTPVNQINNLKRPKDLILVTNPLIFFETLYYSQNSHQVYWYNPQNNAFPWYVGDILFDPKQMTREFPTYPIRAFIIDEKGNFEIIYNNPAIKL